MSIITISEWGEKEGILEENYNFDGFYCPFQVSLVLRRSEDRSAGEFEAEPSPAVHNLSHFVPEEAARGTDAGGDAGGVHGE